MNQLKYWLHEAVIVLKIITYLTAWIIIILILCRRSTPVMALVGIGLHIISTLAILRGGEGAK